ncbi:hypothetical protein PCL_00058 [Purpureocillium lilacinum]|uniref:Uncharacterized protein n=1 Tax=Purpureocillium lilacinum TaxID=33203 RepID=A0A2U3E613_PURLI|nr:hypothetical protein Purlil1_5744 [Purpureocillium lilacinum]PWI69914.1 hypothetical protein PCL_00058 [Purpureocillium lilacinum]
MPGSRTPATWGSGPAPAGNATASPGTVLDDTLVQAEQVRKYGRIGTCDAGNDVLQEALQSRVSSKDVGTVDSLSLFSLSLSQ